MDKIVVIDSAIVRPAHDTPKHKLWLSSLDLIVHRSHLLTVYFYRPNGAPDFFDTGALKRALADVLVPFYPLAGRLATDQNGRLELQCNGEGVLLLQAEANFTIDDYGDFTPGKKFRALIPAVADDDISSVPLLLLQVTTFKCGGVCLGVGWHHTVGDGAAAMSFMKAWADLARGISVTVPPVIDRALLRARNTSVPPTHHCTDYDPSPSMKVGAGSRPSGPLSIAKMKITTDQLNKLKSSGNSGETEPKHTTYETVAAHTWRCAVKARGLESDQLTTLFISVDGRSRMDPPLPPEFFGNVIFRSAVIVPADEVASRPLSSTMDRIHKATAKIRGDYLRSVLDHLEGLPDLTHAMRGPRSFSGTGMNIVSWITLQLQGADFGWGIPIFVGPGDFVEGKAYVIRSAAGDGSLDVFICLESNHMEVFRSIFYDF